MEEDEGVAEVEDTNLYSRGWCLPPRPRLFLLLLLRADRGRLGGGEGHGLQPQLWLIGSRGSCHIKFILSPLSHKVKFPIDEVDILAPSKGM